MPEDILVGFLRQNMSDPKGRSSPWIYSEKPHLPDLLDSKDNFPIISVEPMSLSSISQLGMDCTDQEDQVSLLINVWALKDDIVTLESYEEEISYSTGVSIYGLSNLPFNTVTSIHNNTTCAYVLSGDFGIIDADGDGFYDGITLPEQKNGDSLTIIYNRVGEGSDLVNYLSQTIHQTIRDNWHLSLTPFDLFDYQRIGVSSVIFEDNIRLYRKELQVRFNAINAGD